MFRKLVLAAMLCCSATAQAAYPVKPVHIIVANPPGGPLDVIARLLAAELGKRWNQPVVIDNKPGGSGIISSNALAKAAPDGYTLGLIVASAVTVMPFTVEKLPYDPVADLQPVTLVARMPLLYMVAADSPLKTWEDFVKRAKAGNVTVGSSSIGTTFHLTWEQTARRAGIKGLYAATPSFSKTQTDLVAGLLDIALDTPPSAKGLLDSKKVRPLAVTSPERVPSLPDTPTLSESGLPGFAPQPWTGVMGPAGMDPALAAQIRNDVTEVLKVRELRERMLALGYVPMGSTTQEFADTIARERQEMEPLIKELGIKLN